MPESFFFDFFDELLVRYSFYIADRNESIGILSDIERNLTELVRFEPFAEKREVFF